MLFTTHSFVSSHVPPNLRQARSYLVPKCTRRRARVRMSALSRAGVASKLQSESQGQVLLGLVQLCSLPAADALEVLLSSSTLRSTNPQVRLTAHATLGKLGDYTQCPMLVSAMQSDEDHSVKAACASALGNLFRKRNGTVIRARCEELYDSASSALQDAVEHPGDDDQYFIIKYAAIAALGSLGDPRCVNALINAANSTDPLYVAAAVNALGEIESSVKNVAAQAVVTSKADFDMDLVKVAVANTLGRWVLDCDQSDEGKAMKKKIRLILDNMYKLEGLRDESPIVMNALQYAISEKGYDDDIVDGMEPWLKNG